MVKKEDRNLTESEIQKLIDTDLYPGPQDVVDVELLPKTLFDLQEEILTVNAFLDDHVDEIDTFAGETSLDYFLEIFQKLLILFHCADGYSDVIVKPSKAAVAHDYASFLKCLHDIL